MNYNKTFRHVKTSAKLLFFHIDMTDRCFHEQKQNAIYQNILQNCSAINKMLAEQPLITRLMDLTFNVFTYM